MRLSLKGHKSATKRKVAISEVFGSLIMIAITLIAGISVFGFINGQTGTSASAVGNSAAKNINFLNEREVVVYAATGGASPSQSANVWVYNSGSINPETMSNIAFYDTTSPNVLCTVTVSANIPSTSVVMVAVNVPASPTPSCPSPTSFTTGHTYHFLVIGLYGSTSQLTVQF